LVAWLSCLPCRNWCNIIINFVSSSSSSRKVSGLTPTAVFALATSLFSTHLRVTWFRFDWPRYAFYFVLHCSFLCAFLMGGMVVPLSCKPCCVPHSAPLKLWFLGSSPLPVISACSSQLVPCGACCLPLRAWDTYSSALGRTCPSCGRGYCSGLLVVTH
jgi:hypothetical protein